MDTSMDAEVTSTSEGQYNADLGYEPRTVEDFKHAGTYYKQQQMWDGAIRNYSLGLLIDRICAEDQYYLYSNRCDTFAAMSEHLRSIPAATSERGAYFGMDPFHLANMSLLDAKRIIALLPNSVRGYSQLGRAHMLLEQYREAELAYLQGLGVDPTNEALKAELAKVKAITASSLASRVTARDDLECLVCLKLLYEPVTTPCGHTFCRSCFRASASHYTGFNNGNKCPMCRTVLHVGRDLPITLTLANVIEKSFPAEYAERRAEMQGRPSEPPNEPPLPLFVMQLMLPDEKMALNIFEPRYRLMVRRCMEGNRRFGMAAIVNRQLHPVACECEIVECRPQSDGRFYLEIVGRRRFRMTETWEQDGYRMAAPDFFCDVPVEEGTPVADALLTLSQDVERLIDMWIDKIKSYIPRVRTFGDDVIDRLERVGPKPVGSDLEKLSFWCCNLTPMDSHQRLAQLSTTSTSERFATVRELLQPALDGQPQCSLM